MEFLLPVVVILKVCSSCWRRWRCRHRALEPGSTPVQRWASDYVPPGRPCAGLILYCVNTYTMNNQTSPRASRLKRASDSSVRSAADLLVLKQDAAGYVTGLFNINSFYKSVASAQHVQTTKSHPVNKKRLVKEPGSIKRRNISAIWFQSRPRRSKIYLRCGRRFPIITSAE